MMLESFWGHPRVMLGSCWSHAGSILLPAPTFSSGSNPGLGAPLDPRLFENQQTLQQTVNEKANKLAAYAPKACLELRKLHWKDTQNWESLLPENAKITAKLSLSDFSQNIIKSL